MNLNLKVDQNFTEKSLFVRNLSESLELTRNFEEKGGWIKFNYVVPLRTLIHFSNNISEVSRRFDNFKDMISFLDYVEIFLHEILNTL